MRILGLYLCAPLRVLVTVSSAVQQISANVQTVAAAMADKIGDVAEFLASVKAA